jgi:protein SCO1/2
MQQRGRAAVVALVVCAMLFAGCGTADRDSGERRYELRGKVVEVDRANGELGVEHEAIPGFMDAMTMSFSVADWVLSAAAPGDAITADLVVIGSDTRLENVSISKAPSTNDPDPENRVSGPALGTAIPDLTFLNQDGRRIALGDLRGEILVITFIYTRCPLPDYCPLMTQRFDELADALALDAPLARRVRLLSVTLDPEYDTPPVLKAYSSPYLGAKRPVPAWEFLTSDPETIRRLAEFFGLLYRTESDQIVHSLRTAVVAPTGGVTKVLRGNRWTADDLLAAVRESAG